MPHKSDTGVYRKISAPVGEAVEVYPSFLVCRLQSCRPSAFIASLFVFISHADLGQREISVGQQLHRMHGQRDELPCGPPLLQPRR